MKRTAECPRVTGHRMALWAGSGGRGSGCKGHRTSTSAEKKPAHAKHGRLERADMDVSDGHKKYPNCSGGEEKSAPGKISTVSKGCSTALCAGWAEERLPLLFCLHKVALLSQ